MIERVRSDVTMEEVGKCVGGDVFIDPNETYI